MSIWVTISRCFVIACFENTSKLVSIWCWKKVFRVRNKLFENWNKTLLNVSFVWKLWYDIIRVLSYLKIEIRHYSMSHLFENWDITLYDFFFVLRLRWNTTRCLIRLKNEMWHYTNHILFWNWDVTLYDFFFVWKLRYDTTLFFCFSIVLIFVLIVSKTIDYDYELSSFLQFYKIFLKNIDDCFDIWDYIFFNFVIDHSSHIILLLCHCLL